ncbi:claudin-34-like [Archocentrus centrarchus]|uniref:claudin-34-like n=1 Tax=Archocentrus centrarchus TaxID=63155 RepID=UPI0011EA45AF|nr:claudin-34-like [Archocentrus centrarchus]
MTYLAHTAHAQFGALWLACLGWMLTGVALGLIQWRVWHVSDREVISSGVAWVGLWRACFNSYTVVSEGFRIMYCRYIRLTDSFTPPEIAAGQVLMLLSLLVGLCGNAGGVYSMRNAYFGKGKISLIRPGFIFTGALCLLAAGTSLVPLLWNLSTVVTNQTINFPPEFKLPPAPESQHVGGGIAVGIVGSTLMIVSGIIFCSYRLPLREQLALENASGGQDNPTFESQEHL